MLTKLKRYTVQLGELHINLFVLAGWLRGSGKQICCNSWERSQAGDDAEGVVDKTRNRVSSR